MHSTNERRGNSVHQTNVTKFVLLQLNPEKKSEDEGRESEWVLKRDVYVVKVPSLLDFDFLLLQNQI